MKFAAMPAALAVEKMAPGESPQRAVLSPAVADGSRLLTLGTQGLGDRRPSERHLDGCAGIGALSRHSGWEHADGGHFIPEASPMAATSNAPKVQRAV
jgi:hypothetical protein